MKYEWLLQTYHPVCYEDTKDQSILETPQPQTPSPQSGSTANPMSSMANVLLQSLNPVDSTSPSKEGGEYLQMY